MESNLTSECSVCHGTESMQAQHHLDGEPVYVDCWCTDDDIAPRREVLDRLSAEYWYELGFDDASTGKFDFDRRWGP